MNVIVNRAEFLAAAKRVASVAPLSSPLEPLRGILLKTDRREGCLTVSATNLEVSLIQTILCTSPDVDALVLNARLLEGMLDKLEEDSVTLIRVEQQPVVLFTNGLATYRVGIWERGLFPQVESPYPTGTILVAGTPAMTKRIIFAVGEKRNTPLLCCVNLMFTPNGLKAVGSNGSCVVSAKGDSQSIGNISLLVPASSLGKLVHMCEDTDEFRVGTTGDHIVFFRDGLLFGARLMSGRYINTEQLISSLVNTFTVFTGVTGLRDGLYTACSVEADGKVMLHFEGDRLIFRYGGVYGNAVFQIDVIPLRGTPRGEFWYLTRPLLTCLDALFGMVQLGTAQGGLLTISTEDAFYMQNGVHPPSEQQSFKAVWPMGLKILSCGAGMQSTAMALISCAQVDGPVEHPEVPRYDAMIYCDLGTEPEWVVRQVAFLEDACTRQGIPFYILKSDLYQDYMENLGVRRVADMPFWMLDEDGEAGKIHRRACTIEYKILVIQKLVRYGLLGYQLYQRLVRKDIGAHELHIGFSYEEANRSFPSHHKMFKNRFPLIEIEWQREDTYAYNLNVWGLDTKASACCICPYHQSYFFQYLKEHYPRHHQNVVGFDSMLENMQPPNPIRNRIFLSRSRKRIRDFRPKDCDGAQTFDYQGRRI